MKKRIFSLLMSLVMVISLVGVLPTMTASADNPFSSAKAISLNSSYTDALLTNKDIRYYSFTLNSAGKVNISFGKEYDNEGYGWDLTVYNSYQEELHSQHFKNGNSITEKTPSLGLPKGKFYIKIQSHHSWYETTADYTLKVNYQIKNNWETEINNDFSSADNITLNNMYYGAVTNNEDDDFYKISIPKTGYYNLYFGKQFNSDGYGWKVTIYNKYQKELYSQHFDKGNSKTDILKTKLTNGINYIKVQSYHSWYETNSDYNIRISLHLPNVTGLKTSSTSTNSIKLKWNKVSGAKGYVVYQNGKKIKTVTGTSLTVSKLKSGTTYKFTVKPYTKSSSKTIYGNASKTLTTSTNPAKVSFKLTSGKKNATLKWSKVTGASGYKVYYKTSKNGAWKLLKTASSKTTNYTKTGLKKGKTYYFTVKSYRKVNGKTYNGSYAIKSIKSK